MDNLCDFLHDDVHEWEHDYNVNRDARIYEQSKTPRMIPSDRMNPYAHTNSYTGSIRLPCLYDLAKNEATD